MGRSTRLAACLAAACVVALGVGVAVVFATDPVIDQQLLSWNADGTVCSGMPNGQTFTPTASNMVGFRISRSNQFPAGGLTASFQIRRYTSGERLDSAGSIANTLSTISNVHINTNSTGDQHTLEGNTDYVPLPSQISLTPGQKYIIVITSCSGWQPFKCAGCSGPYAGGGFVNFYFSTTDTGIDMLFATYANPDSVGPDVEITQVSAPADGYLAAADVTTFPATVGSQPVAVSGTSSDPSGVSSVDLNGTAATGTTAWSVSGFALASGANTLTATATDTLANTNTANVSVTYNADLDSDGIRNNIDELPSASSSRFDDTLKGGATHGEITSIPSGMAVTIEDQASPDGVRATVTGPAGSKVRIKLDGKGTTLRLSPGTYTITDPDVETTLVTEVDGPGEFEFTLNGVPNIVTVPAGASATLTETLVNGNLTGVGVEATGDGVEVNGDPVGGGETASIGSLHGKITGGQPKQLVFRGTFKPPTPADPLAELTMLKVGPIDTTIRAGDWKQSGNVLTFSRKLDSRTKFSVQLAPLSGGAYKVTIEITTPSRLTRPVTITFGIGNDSAAASL